MRVPSGLVVLVVSFIAAASSGCGVGPWAITAVGVAAAGSDDSGDDDAPPSVNIQSNLIRGAFADPDFVAIEYLLRNDDGGALDVLVEFSIDGGLTFSDCEEDTSDAASEGRTGLLSSVAGIPHRFTWAAGADLGGLDEVVVRVAPVEAGKIGVADASPPFFAGNDGPVATVVTPALVELNGTIAFSLADTSGDGCGIVVQVSTDGTFPTLPATRAELLAALSDPLAREALHIAAVPAVHPPETGLGSSATGGPEGDHIFVWDSRAAAPVGVGRERVETVTLRFTPFDSEPGVADTTDPFTADNNSNPTVILENPQFGLDRTREIPISYTARDFESNPVDLIVQFALGDDEFEPLPTDRATLLALLDDPVAAAAAKIATEATRVVEGPLQRIPAAEALDPLVAIRSDAFVREGLAFEQGEPPVRFIIGKRIEVFQEAALVSATAVAEFDAATATVTLRDALPAAIDHSKPGVFFRVHAVEGVRALATTPAGVDHVFLWDSATDIPDAAVTTARIRLVPIDSEVGFEERTDLPFDLENGPVASAAIPSTGQSPGAIAPVLIGTSTTALVVLNEETDDLDLFTVGATNDFTRRQTIALEFPNPSRVAVGDIDGNGFQDLAIAYRDFDFVTLLVQDAAGAFAPHPQDGLATGGLELTQAPAAGTSSAQKYEDLARRAIAIGDVSGDGLADLLVANPINDTFAVFFQRLDGGLGVAALGVPDAILFAGDSPQDLAIADIDGDGPNDVAIVNLLSGDITLYEQDGDGDLAPRPLGPSPRTRATLAFADFAGGDRLVLFGGETNGSVLGKLNDTREFVDGAWTPTRSSDPPLSRHRHAAAYDPVAQAVIVYGGSDMENQRRSDTWSYAEAGWALLSPAANPGARDDHAMTYAAPAGGVVLFGGVESTGGLFVQRNDLWKLAAGDWSAIVAHGTPGSPSARSNAAIAFDASRGKLVLFGGRGTNLNAIGDTWEFDFALGTWAQKAIAGPAARFDHEMVYHGDATSGTIVLFGGRNQGGTLFGDTWVYDGASWVERTGLDPKPAARSDHAMTYDGASGLTVLFGGSEVVATNTHADHWTWNGTAWTAVPLQTLETGTLPTGIVTLDPAAAGGPLDLATANSTVAAFNRGGANITLFLQDPLETWTFTSPAPVAAGSSPYGIAAGTVNGALTLAVTDRDGDSTLLFTLAGGVLTPAGTIASMDEPVGVAFADVDKDGAQDLIVAASRDNSTLAFAQEVGMLGSSLVEVASAATSAGPTEVIAGDLTGDGRSDLAVLALTANRVDVYTQDASGRISAAPTLTAGNNAFGIGVGDLNGDGRNDLAVGNLLRSVDLTGDGVADVPEVSLFFQTEAGAFGEKQRRFLVRNPPTVTADVIVNATDAAIGDVTNDGRGDLVVADAGQLRVLIYPQLANGTVATLPTAIIGTVAPIRELKIADVNCDGRNDIVGIAFTQFSGVSFLIVLRQKTDGTFANVTGAPPAQSYLVPAGSGATADPRNLSIGDLNGDGRADAVTANPGDGTVTVYTQSATGLLLPVTGAPVPLISGSVPRGAGIGDFNRDGAADVVMLQNGADRVNVHLRTSGAAARPAFRPRPGQTTDSAPSFVETRDFNGDGRPDAIVTGLLGGRLRVFLQR